MPEPISSDPRPDKRYASESDAVYQAQHGNGPSFVSQFHLRALYAYLDSCRATLDEIRADLSFNFAADAGARQPLQRAVERLGGFCMDADSWGFDELYKAAIKLQVQLMDFGSQARGDDYWDSLRRGLSLMAVLLDQCDNEYRRRLMISEMR